MRPDSPSAFEATVEAFAVALTDPRSSPPAQIRGREGAPDGRRFAVYRNNVAVSLIASLAARYPVTRRLVGDDFFRAAARLYAAANKPQSPVLIHYGRDFPDFVDAFEPARDLVYLADVAALENAWVESYHASDVEPLSLSELAAFDERRLASARVAAHPAARLLKSAHPVASIWSAHQGADQVGEVEIWAPEEVLVARPQAEVVVRLLPPGGCAFASALFSGATITEAHQATQVENFDAGAHLVGLIQAGALTRLEG
jgi:hypothetical protein